LKKILHPILSLYVDPSEYMIYLKLKSIYAGAVIIGPQLSSATLLEEPRPLCELSAALLEEPRPLCELSAHSLSLPVSLFSVCFRDCKYTLLSC
jgi:hypothetical protein